MYRGGGFPGRGVWTCLTVAWLRIQSWIMCITRWGTRCEACADDAIACLLDAQEASTEMQRHEALTQQRLKDECANERRERDREQEAERASLLSRDSARARAEQCERDCRELRAQIRESEKARAIERERLESALHSLKERERALLSREASCRQEFDQKVSDAVRSGQQDREVLLLSCSACRERESRELTMVACPCRA